MGGGHRDHGSAALPGLLAEVITRLTGDGAAVEGTT
jgi:hypothetical protein